MRDSEPIWKIVREELINNQAVRKSGGYVSIPFLSFPKLMTELVGIEKEKYYGTTASSKVGKTKLADRLFVEEPFNFIEQVKDTDIDFEIFYYSLEVSAQQKFLSILSNHIFKKFGKLLRSTRYLL